MLAASRVTWGEAFPKEDEDWRERRPDTPSWNQPNDVPRGKRFNKKREPVVETDDGLDVERNYDDPESSITEQPPPPPKRQPEPQKEEREVTSYEESGASKEATETEKPSSPGPTRSRLRFGILGGVSSVKSGDSSSQNARVEQALTQNFFLGGILEGRLGKYFGAEVEGFVGIAPDVEISDTQGTNAQVKSLQQTGVLAQLIGQIPLGIFIPRVGVGFGLLGLKHTLTVTSTQTSSSEKVSGLFLSGGLDIEVSPYVTLTGEYGHTLDGAASFSSSATGSTTPAASNSKGSFDRIRLGLYYNFSPRVVAGLLFHMRNLASALKPHSSTTPTGAESFSQFMFAGMVQF